MEIQGNHLINMSGFSKIEFTLDENVNSISFPDDEHHVHVSLINGTDWNTVYFTPDTENLKVTQHVDSTGIYYKTVFSFKNPKITGVKAIQFNSIREHDLVIVATTSNGDKILIGTKEQPARIESNLSIPNVGGNRNERQVSIEAITDEEPYFVKYIDETGGAFSDGFSTGFKI